MLPATAIVRELFNRKKTPKPLQQFRWDADIQHMCHITSHFYTTMFSLNRQQKSKINNENIKKVAFSVILCYYDFKKEVSINGTEALHRTENKNFQEK